MGCIGDCAGVIVIQESPLLALLRLLLPFTPFLPLTLPSIATPGATASLLLEDLEPFLLPMLPF